MAETDKLELSNNEKTLIKALREMDEIPINMLLWYVAGLEESIKKVEKSFGDSQLDEVKEQNAEHLRKVEIASKYMRERF